MSIFRLLPFSLLIITGVASAAAQSSTERNRVVVPAPVSGQPNSSGGIDLLSPKLSPDLNPQKPLDRIHIEEYSPRLAQLDSPRVFLFDPGWQGQDGTLCYAIRGYKVARDDPDSDSTHAAGYSTCQPATRFHVHTGDERVLAPRP
ncbi:MAG: hypothetical protein WBE31_09830 [Candidatus Sulfotelmatobacter sp.]